MNVMQSPFQPSRHPREASHTAYTLPKDVISEQPPDHLSLSGQINVTKAEARQLLEELGELRARLSPILMERDMNNRAQSFGPTLCAAAADLSEAHQLIANCRELVYYTLAQLDL